jgi:hypothetical protein
MPIAPAISARDLDEDHGGEHDHHDRSQDLQRMTLAKAWRPLRMSGLAALDVIEIVS